MTLSSKIFIGLLLGIATGIFFGEVVAPLKLLGDIFIQLLQVTVLPYIMLSLIAGIGRMNMATARKLALRGLLVLLAIWGLALILILVAGLAFPDLQTASFFGSSHSHESVPVNLLELYLPANVFYSLANNLVPAVVLFSILMGVAIISVEGKEHILPLFDGMAAALAKVNNAIVQLTPYGIFAIASAAAGTMTLEQLGLVQVYLITYIGLALLVTFWVFPALVATLSGIPYRTVLSTFRDALVTAFATGNQFVVLPQIAENCKTLLAKRTGKDTEYAAVVDVLVPVSFNFPSLGKLLVLLYVLFAAWFTDTQLSLADQVGLAFNGLFSLFGSINVAVPYLLDTLRIPADMFQLFLVTGIVVGRFGAMLAALHIVVLTVLGALAIGGALRLDLRAILRYLLFSAIAMLALVVCLQGYFSLFVPQPPAREEVLKDIHLMEPRVEAQLLRDSPLLPESQMQGVRLDHIVESGVLQVGYRPSNLPCSFLTAGGELVGFDIEMAHIMAQDLGVSLQFVPFTFDKLQQQLSTGVIDIAMSCIASLPDRYRAAAFSTAYLDLNLALIVKDHQRAEFSDVERLRERRELTIALVSSHYFQPRLQQLVPNANIIVLESAEDFFDGHGQGADALLLSAEEGVAYAYRYPSFAVVTAKKGGARLPAAYALPRGDLETVAFVSNWIDLKQKDGTVAELYQYWMLGGVTEAREPRWSILRDVLGWID